MKPSWQIIKLSGTLGVHAAAWDELNASLFRSNPMLHSRFVDALIRHFGTGEEYLCLLTTEAKPRAMCLMNSKGMGVWSTFLPSQAQVGPALITDSSDVSSLLLALPGTTGSVDLMCYDAAFGDITQGKPSSSAKDHALTMHVNLDGNFDDYWSSRSKQLKKNIRRYERRLEDDQIHSRFVCISQRQDIAEAVNRYANLESKGWKAGIGTAISVDNSQGQFYNEVMYRFADLGGALVYELWLGEQLAASRLAIWSQGMIVILKTTYDEALDKYAPGRLLLREVIQSAFLTHPGNVIEFYTDASADQLSWSTGQRWIRHINFPRSRMVGKLYQAARFGRRIFKGHNPDGKASGHDVIVEVFPHPDKVPPDVAALFDQAETEHIEFGRAWFRNLVNAVYPSHEGVRIYVARSGKKPVAALPILVQKYALGHRVESLGNYYTAVYAPVVSPDASLSDLVTLLKTVRADYSQLASIRMSPMDPKSSTYLLFEKALKAAGLVPFEFFCFGNWYLPVQGNWDAYLMTRPGTLRSTIKRMTKKFQADGGTLELLQGSAEVERALTAYEQVYALSWKDSEPYPNFVQGLARTCAERGWLRLGVAWLDGKPIAAQIWIVSNDSANIYKVAYDEAFKAYTPGTLVTAMMMQHVIETDKVSKVDYLMGDDPYKKTWMSERQERWGIIAYNPRSIGGLFELCREALGRLVKLGLAKWKKLG